MNGVLVVDKPAGVTSADVVARVKRELGADRVGHAGTLDPMATGVLPILVGEGTKLAPFLLAEDKEYEGELELGFTTNTLDVEGQEVARAPWQHVTEEALRAAMAAWMGEREQIPPMVSALKHQGKRLYELARKGIEVERAARPVRIERFDLISFTPPRARFVVACSKGTYVRALARDVGDALGCGATLTALRRTRAGRFTIEQTGAVVGLADAIAHLPAVHLDADTVRNVVNGKPFSAPAGTAEGTVLRLLDPTGALVAVVESTGAKVRYLRVFRC